MTRTAHRRNALVIGAVVILLAIVSVVVGLLLGQPDSSEPAPQASASPNTIVGQRTLLLQATDARGAAVANVLLGSAPTGGRGALLQLPASLLVPAPAPMPLRLTPGSSDTLAARRGVASLLGVRVDASVIVDRLALAALVDGVGGVPLDIRSPVEIRDAKGVVTQIIPTGARVLDGVTAADYALATLPGESRRDAQERFAQVLTQVLRALPDNSGGMAQLVRSLGSLAKSTVTNDELVAVLEQLQRTAAADELDVAELPTLTVRADAAAVMPWPAGQGAVHRLFPEAATTAPAAEVVAVWQAGASAAQAAAATLALSDAGFTPINVGPTQASATRVYVPDDTPDLIATGTRVAQALGLDGSVVVVGRGARSAGGIVVLVGRDLPAL